MNFLLQVPLNASSEQQARLHALQAGFARVCNALAPTVQQTRVWNRVALHHLMYRTLRERFPEMGSQMVCNAIYAVSRTSRLLFQHADSPLNLTRLAGKPLPLLRFGDTNPVYFDRHTLSVKDGQLSMYTLDGRMRFALALTPADEVNFNEKKLREVILTCRADGVFELSFLFSDANNDTGVDVDVDDEVASSAVRNRSELSRAESGRGGLDRAGLGRGEIPEYVMVEEAQ